MTDARPTFEGGKVSAPSHRWGSRSGERQGLGRQWHINRPIAWKRAAGLCQHHRYDIDAPCLAPGAAVDHIRPHHLGGTSDLQNLQILCKFHHDQKSAQEAADAKREKRRKASLSTNRKRTLGAI
ncbi:HNH endonuclease signature motif containing protein [Streptomyces sp. NPDC004732]|uniref:HNH endonuclease n=1 Tax=Streptomyces sp. NPDC004732 TaxID=3154290 RepID=UPI0033AD854C